MRRCPGPLSFGRRRWPLYLSTPGFALTYKVGCLIFTLGSLLSGAVYRLSASASGLLVTANVTLGSRCPVDGSSPWASERAIKRLRAWPYQALRMDAVATVERFLIVFRWCLVTNRVTRLRWVQKASLLGHASGRNPFGARTSIKRVSPNAHSGQELY